MQKTTRDIRQQELAEQWITSGQYGIINAAPRMGKIRTTIIILQKQRYKKVLIAYPDLKIRDSWKADFATMEYDDSDVTYTTHLSLKKHVDEQYDLIIIDECHLISMAQMEAIKLLKINHRKILGLTGTLSSWTKKELLEELHLPVVATYSIDQAISEGVISDYDITVIKVPLDGTIKQLYKRQWKTEKAQFDMLSRVINKLQYEGKDTMFMRLARMRIIQNSEAKRQATINYLLAHSKERILIFCGVISIADNLGVPSYHSKSSEKQIFEDFANGIGNHLAVVKIGNTGVTYKPLNQIVINYFDSNSENLVQKIMRCMSFEYDNPDKKAYIYIVISDESIELQWLQKALIELDKSKIRYL
jgi:superfamily II DNA or RNA helicase